MPSVTDTQQYLLENIGSLMGTNQLLGEEVDKYRAVFEKAEQVPIPSAVLTPTDTAPVACPAFARRRMGGNHVILCIFPVSGWVRDRWRSE